jgi:hypothetical protein
VRRTLAAVVLLPCDTFHMSTERIQHLGMAVPAHVRLKTVVVSERGLGADFKRHSHSAVLFHANSRRMLILLWLEGALWALRGVGQGVSRTREGGCVVCMYTQAWFFSHTRAHTWLDVGCELCVAQHLWNACLMWCHHGLLAPCGET